MNAMVVNADGSTGHAAEAPFDVIVLSGSVAEIPEVLLAQFELGRRIAAIDGLRHPLDARHLADSVPRTMA